MSTVATLPVASKPDPVALDPVKKARALGPALTAAGDTIERTQEIPEPLLSQLHEARLFRMLLPRSVGGDEVEPWTYLRAVEEIAAHDGSVGWNIFVANSSALIAPFLPPEAARAIFGDPRAWSPGARRTRSKAIAVPGGYRVTGQWHFASGCRQATWMGAHCHVVEPDGSLRLNRRPADRAHAAVARSRRRRCSTTWKRIGMRGTASEAYRLDDVFVPEAFSGTREDPTLRREPGRLYAFPMQGLYAVGVAGVAMGIARAMLDAFKELAARKTPRDLGAARRQCGGAVERGAAGGAARRGARLSGGDPEGHLGRRRRHRVDRRRPTGRACAWAARWPSRRPTAVADYAYKAAGTSMRSSSARRSSGASATSTPCRSRSSRARRTSRRSAR